MFAKVIVPSTLLLAVASVQGMNFARETDWFEARNILAARDLQQRSALGQSSLFEREYALEQRDLFAEIEAAIPALIQILPSELQAPASSIYNEITAGIAAGAAAPTPAVPTPAIADLAATSSATDPQSVPTDTNVGAAGAPPNITPAPSPTAPSKRDFNGFLSKMSSIGNNVASAVASSSSASTTGSSSGAVTLSLPYASLLAVVGVIAFGAATVL